MNKANKTSIKVQLMNKKTYFLPFENVEDLIEKVEKIKSAHLIRKQSFCESLTKVGFNFTELSKYNIAIDIEGLTKKQLEEIIKNNDTSIIENVYKECRVFKIDN